MPIRTLIVNELLGADYTEHNILHGGIGMEVAVEILKHIEDDIDLDLEPTGKNLGLIIVFYLSACNSQFRQANLYILIIMSLLKFIF